jgi:hypothetical protein
MAERTLTDRIMGFVYDNGPQPVRDFIERRESRREAEEHYRKEAADNRPLQSTTLREHIADRVYEAMPERVQSRLDDRAIQKLVVQQDIAAAQSAVKSATQPARERAWAAADAQASLDLSPRQTQSARAAVRLGG